MARAAALLAVKQASSLLPQLQPIATSHTEIRFTLEGEDLLLEVEVRAVTATGLGTHALAAAAVAAVCVYDLVSPQRDGPVVIERIELAPAAARLRAVVENGTAVVIVLSDSVAAGTKPDTAGKSIVARLEAAGFATLGYEVLSDDSAEMAGRVQHWMAQKPDVIMTVGGTGLGSRDHTVEAIRPLLTTEVPGVMEAARAYGQARTPYAMLSRGIAGVAGNSVVVTMPGSRRGAEETFDAIIVGLIHLIDVARVTRAHDGGYE